MFSLFIFKSNSRGMQYGIGTYLRELTEALLVNFDIRIYVVSYNNRDYLEFTIDNVSPRYSNIFIPGPKISPHQNNSSDIKYASVVLKLLSDFISVNEEIVFLMNFIDDLPIIQKLKEVYNHPVIKVVHTAEWHHLFNCNRQKMKGLNINTPSNNIEYTLSREKEIYLLSDHIISVTCYMKDFLVNEYGIPGEKIDIVHNGINHCKYLEISDEEKLKLKHDLGFGQHEKIILFSGRIDPCKGVFFLLEAFEKACRFREDLRLVLIGEGNIQECFRKYKSFYGKITFTGFLSIEKVALFYRVADIGIIPSVYDHCPYTVLEMMSYNIPLIMSRVDGLREILDDTQCVFVNPVVSDDGEISFDKNEIADAILTLANHKEKARELTKDYKELIQSRFSAQRMAAEIYSIIKIRV